MSDGLLMLILLASPLLGLALLPVLPEESPLGWRLTAMAAMHGSLVAGCLLFASCHGSSAAGSIDIPWIDSLGLNLHLAVDGLNAYFLLLTVVIFPVVLACAWSTRQAGDRLFLALLLALEISLLGTFLSQNLMLFFIFWEAVLIPGSLMILVFGGEQGRKAATTFFLYTLAGSVLLLAAIILLGVESVQQTGTWSFELSTLTSLSLSWNSQLFVFAALALACAIKCPIFPFHSWLPLVYCEAPFSGTALMAGVLSKMGVFGLLKLALPLCPDVARAAAPYAVSLAVVSILYGAVLALRQQEFKRLIAWSSLSHMGYIVLGIFSLQQSSLHGSLFQVLSHGLAVAGLFLVLSLLEQRVGGGYREITALSTLAPRLAVVAMLFIVTSIALPLTSGFTSEFLILFGAFQKGMAAWQAGSSSLFLLSALVACSGMVLGAGYMLRFGRKLLFGSTASSPLPDLNLLEMISFLPLLLLILWIGISPGWLLEKTKPAVSSLTAGANQEPPRLLLSAHLQGAFDGH
ncbi:NADH-quinone oxidoreductase subunit M [Geomonas sp.]|uniref:complex I subunit 4 family protein n=1 Tax=Geomonas sp. TaxID=2651584 RepID=UPI002B476245|nr:NADH-quinone oxidoreductase subunit M [Geomonas sp.]HJV35104.1 NADH-quinone oxidoreductase subunit M [Geomonas sp.]